MVGAACQAGDADSSRAPGLTSGLQGSVNVHRGALLLVPQWQNFCSFVFYINVMCIEICARNVINLKGYASRKNKPLNKFDGFQNILYAQ